MHSKRFRRPIGRTATPIRPTCGRRCPLDKNERVAPPVDTAGRPHSHTECAYKACEFWWARLRAAQSSLFKMTFWHKCIQIQPEERNKRGVMVAFLFLLEPTSLDGVWKAGHAETIPTFPSAFSLSLVYGVEPAHIAAALSRRPSPASVGAGITIVVATIFESRWSYLIRMLCGFCI